MRPGYLTLWRNLHQQNPTNYEECYKGLGMRADAPLGDEKKKKTEEGGDVTQQQQAVRQVH